MSICDSNALANSLHIAVFESNCTTRRRRRRRRHRVSYHHNRTHTSFDKIYWRAHFPTFSFVLCVYARRHIQTTRIFSNTNKHTVCGGLAHIEKHKNFFNKVRKNVLFSIALYKYLDTFSVVGAIEFSG